MTRAAPARSLGLADRGRLSAGAIADVVVYRPQSDIEAMFRAPAHVFKAAVEVARDG
jgi:formylmethanofuran dehydrogenase subunit A